MFQRYTDPFSTFKNQAMSAQARIVFDRANAVLFAQQLAAKAGLSEARAFLTRAEWDDGVASAPAMAVNEARDRWRQRIAV
jgi:hypothetical protein